jgi:hypothetical protein
MRLINRIVLIVALLIFFNGCTVTKIFYPGTYSYTAKKNDLTLIIYLIDPLARIDYYSSVEEEFGKGNSNELIYNFFKEQLCKDIDSLTIFRNVHYDRLAPGLETKEITIRIPARGEKSFDIPVDNETAEFSEFKADFVLFLDEISIVSNYQADVSRISTPVYDPYRGTIIRKRPTTTYSSKDLNYESKFILWDNTLKATVSYGYVRAVKENKKSVSKEDWLSVSKMYVNKLFTGTPFKKP